MATQQEAHSCVPTAPVGNEGQTHVPDQSLWEVFFAATGAEPPRSDQITAVDCAGTRNPVARQRKKVHKIVGAVIGKLAGRNDTNQPLIEFPGSPSKQGLPARTLVPWTDADVGKEVVLTFERGRPRKPIIMGFLQPSQPALVPRSPAVQAHMDGERLVFTAEKEIVLRCGKATLTLTQAGKVLLQGTYLVSRSSGVNRIKGGSVQIN